MTAGGIPHHVEPRTLAAKQVLLQGSVEAKGFPRLQGVVSAVLGPVRASAQFFRDEERRYAVEVTISASVTLVCQRCLDEFEWQVDSQALLAVVWNDEQVAKLPKRYEPVITGSEMDFWGVLEDELLLALPTYPQHAGSACAPLPAGGKAEGDSQVNAAAEGRKPFAELAALKGQLE